MSVDTLVLCDSMAECPLNRNVEFPEPVTVWDKILGLLDTPAHLAASPLYPFCDGHPEPIFFYQLLGQIPAFCQLAHN